MSTSQTINGNLDEIRKAIIRLEAKMNMMESMLSSIFDEVCRPPAEGPNP